MDRVRTGLLLLAMLLCGAPRAQALPPPVAASPVTSLIARGDAALRAGDSISAIGFYLDAVARAPRDPRGYVALGRAYLTVREPEHAREAFESGLRHTHGSDALALGLAELYEQMGQYERALVTVRRLARGADDVLVVQDTLARLAERRGSFTEALAARRARVTLLCAPDVVDRAACDQEATRVRALMLLIGGAERLSPKQCAVRGDSLVLSVLLGCR